MLDDAIERSKQIYGPMGARWHEQAKTWRFGGGGRLRFRPLERLDDADKYQGQNISDACVEEAGQYPDPRPIDRLRGALRSATGVPAQLILTGNPGGAGQGWIKARYIDPAPKGMRVLVRKFEMPEWAGGGFEEVRSVFIPSRLGNNRYLGRDYVAGLHLVGSDALVKAWLEGDWTAIEGAFFDGWSMERHVVSPFEIPEHWGRFRSFDWGYDKPFSIGWWAIASEDGIVPRGCLIRYREWYGASSPNVGVRLEAEQIGAGIAARETDRMSAAVADTQIFAQEGRALGYMGPTIGERLNKTLAAAERMPFVGADKSRKQGWDQVRARLRGDLGGNPMLVVFSTCTDFIRTVPVMQHDQIDPEDLDTESEDHIADEARYACMSRPWARPTPQPDKPLIDTRIPTLAAVVKATLKKRQNHTGRI